MVKIKGEMRKKQSNKITRKMIENRKTRIFFFNKKTRKWKRQKWEIVPKRKQEKLTAT